MLTAHLIAILLTQTPDSLLGDVGESCRARADCRTGLKCINSQCAAPAVAVPQTKEGQACEATADCSSDGSLRCVAKVCKVRGGSSSNATFSPPPPPPAVAPAYVPSNARLSADAPAPVNRSATLVGAQSAPPLPSREGGMSISQQILTLETDIDSINAQLRAVQTGWPGGSIALVVIGAVLSPLALAGLILLAIPVVGIPVLLIGLGGVAMIVVGAVGGSRVNAEALAEREALIQRREAAERELGNLKRMAAVSSRNTRADAAMVTVAAF
ncbi:MAG: hypothetical protein JNM69_26525 [Archangium sp.]|nr:hypothetical protein [Archangium sp.]